MKLNHYHDGAACADRIRQIHENRHDSNLKKNFGNLLLVGIHYDKNAKGADAKRHSCMIEKV